MSEPVRPLEEFADWLDWSDCEKLHWQYDEIIAEKDGSFRSLHPTRPFKKNIEEIFPVVLLGKHLLGQRRNWDQRLQLKFNIYDASLNGQQFDAEYKFISYQPNISQTDDRAGFIEITRALDDSEGNQERLRDRVLFEEGSTLGYSTYKEEPKGEIKIVSHQIGVDLIEFLNETKDIILRRLKEKSVKDYPINTSLVIWLKNEKNPRNSSIILSDLNFREEVRKVAGNSFSAVYLIGVSTGCHLLIGNEL